MNKARTEAFLALVTSHPHQAGRNYPSLNGRGDAWGTPYAEGSASDPVWKLTGTVDPEVSVLADRGFHAPEWLGDQLTGTSDSPLVVMDRGFECSVWAANCVVVAPFTIQVGAAGLFEHRSNGLDRRNPRSDNTDNFRSRGCIPDSMVIRRDAMDAAMAAGTGLGYVLHMFFVETLTTDGFCHPMVGTESGKHGWGAEGERICIRPDVDLTTRDLSPAALAIARTLQEHGCYLGDNSGSKSALKLEQSSAIRDPWVGVDLNQSSLGGITWDDFVVIERGWQ